MCCLLVLLVTPIPNSSVSGQGQRRTEEICRFLLEDIGCTENVCHLSRHSWRRLELSSYQSLLVP